MKLEDQVCSLELAKKLNKLGVKQESHFSWYEYKGLLPILRESISPVGNNSSAFTVAELGEMLPTLCTSHRMGGMQDGFQWASWYRVGGQAQYASHQGEDIKCNADTEADARAKMLIYLLENQLLSGKES